MSRTVTSTLAALALLLPGRAAAHPCEATVKELAGEVTRLENLVAAAGLLRFKIADGPQIPEGPARDAVDRLLAVL
jgi:hypothetical protein